MDIINIKGKYLENTIILCDMFILVLLINFSKMNEIDVTIF